MHRIFACALTALTLSAITFGSGAAYAQNVRVRGTVVDVQPNNVSIQGTDGTVQVVTLKPDLRVDMAARIKLEDIKPGSYIGVASAPVSGNTYRAMGVNVFPEAARGTGEGSFAWDLAPGSQMTNATVSEATVVSKAEGRTLTVTFKDTVSSQAKTDSSTKTQTILVGENTPVQTFYPADRSILVKGAHVVAFASRDKETVTSGRIMVGKDGFQPAI